MLKEQVKERGKTLIEQCVEKGIERGEAEFLSRQLGQKFGLLSDGYRRRINEAVSEQLLAWGERILTAERIEDVFGT